MSCSISSNSSSTVQSKKRRAEQPQGRCFLESWLTLHPWINPPTEKNANVICKVCSEAYEKKLPCTLNQDLSTKRSLQAFVIDGFSTWKNALASFRKHEKSILHVESFKGLSSLKNDSIAQNISDSNKKQMIEARIVLEKIYECIEFISDKAYPSRTHDDKENILKKLLIMRSNDVPELRSWLNRSSTYKWLHHNTTEEIMKMMSDSILKMLISEVKNSKYYSIMIDETSDVARLEQVSICVRFVEEDFTIREEFLGFYETKSTTSETLFKVVKDVLIRFGLDINNVRGQCYDGAANVRGYKSGLQTKLIEEEPRALFVHCAAHRLNLAVQDNLQEIQIVRDFIGVAQNLINFVKDSPKRLAFFKDMQNQYVTLDNPNPITLLKYCPTRWCLRIKSLRTIIANYQPLMDFFEGIVTDRCSDASATASASGFLQKMECFDFYFSLKVIIIIFEKIELLNQQLQGSQLSVNLSHQQVEHVILSLVEQRNADDSFSKLWKNIIKEASDLKLSTPALPRIRKIPKKLDSDAQGHQFSSPEEYFRKQFFEILDNTISSISERFEKSTTSFFDKFENFLIKNANDADTDTQNCQDIVDFYKDGLDTQRLLVQRDMLLDVIKEKSPTNEKPSSTAEVVQFLRENASARKLLTQISELCRIILTVPATTCTAERSFSALRRIKTYLRSTLIAQRLNNVAVLHTHNDYLSQINRDELLNEWVSKNKIRTATFFIKKK